MRLILIGAALAAVSALPASAYEVRDYSMRADETPLRPGLEYVVVDRKGKKIRVIEGQPRWAEQNSRWVQEIATSSTGRCRGACPTFCGNGCLCVPGPRRETRDPYAVKSLLHR